jgi:hypothetical protein
MFLTSSQCCPDEWGGTRCVAPVGTAKPKQKPARIESDTGLGTQPSLAPLQKRLGQLSVPANDPPHDMKDAQQALRKSASRLATQVWFGGDGARRRGRGDGATTSSGAQTPPTPTDSTKATAQQAPGSAVAPTDGPITQDAAAPTAPAFPVALTDGSKTQHSAAPTAPALPPTDVPDTTLPAAAPSTDAPPATQQDTPSPPLTDAPDATQQQQVPTSASATPGCASRDLPNSLTLLGGQYKLFWRVDVDSAEVVICAEVTSASKKLGWIGFGVADPKQDMTMNGADLVVGRMVNGGWEVEDYWATNTTSIRLDAALVHCLDVACSLESLLCSASAPLSLLHHFLLYEASF